MDVPTLARQVLARADELMLNAPGRVNVRRLTDIAEVRALRTARESLTEQELQALKLLRLETIERLDGSVSVRGPKAKEQEKKRGLFGSLLATASENFLSDMTATAGVEQMAREDGVPNRLPAPIDLIDAAENWAISYLTSERVNADVDLEALRAPWLEATITVD